jgi:hypothetical protein
MTDLIERMRAADVEPCDDGSFDHLWRHIDAVCDSCGDHDALWCDTCCEVLHQPDHPELYDDLVEALGVKET